MVIGYLHGAVAEVLEAGHHAVVAGALLAVTAAALALEHGAHAQVPQVLHRRGDGGHRHARLAQAADLEAQREQVVAAAVVDVLVERHVDREQRVLGDGDVAQVEVGRRTGAGHVHHVDLLAVDHVLQARILVHEHIDDVGGVGQHVAVDVQAVGQHRGAVGVDHDMAAAGEVAEDDQLVVGGAVFEVQRGAVVGEHRGRRAHVDHVVLAVDEDLAVVQEAIRAVLRGRTHIDPGIFHEDPGTGVVDDAVVAAGEIGVLVVAFGGVPVAAVGEGIVAAGGLDGAEDVAVGGVGDRHVATAVIDGPSAAVGAGGTDVARVADRSVVTEALGIDAERVAAVAVGVGPNAAGIADRDAAIAVGDGGDAEGVAVIAVGVHRDGAAAGDRDVAVVLMLGVDAEGIAAVAVGGHGDGAGAGDADTAGPIGFDVHAVGVAPIAAAGDRDAAAVEHIGVAVPAAVGLGADAGGFAVAGSDHDPAGGRIGHADVAVAVVVGIDADRAGATGGDQAAAGDADVAEAVPVAGLGVDAGGRAVAADGGDVAGAAVDGDVAVVAVGRNAGHAAVVAGGLHVAVVGDQDVSAIAEQIHADGFAGEGSGDHVAGGGVGDGDVRVVPGVGIDAGGRSGFAVGADVAGVAHQRAVTAPDADAVRLADVAAGLGVAGQAVGDADRIAVGLRGDADGPTVRISIGVAGVDHRRGADVGPGRDAGGVVRTDANDGTGGGIGHADVAGTIPGAGVDAAGVVHVGLRQHEAAVGDGDVAGTVAARVDAEGIVAAEGVHVAAVVDVDVAVAGRRFDAPGVFGHGHDHAAVVIDVDRAGAGFGVDAPRGAVVGVRVGDDDAGVGDGIGAAVGGGPDAVAVAGRGNHMDQAAVDDGDVAVTGVRLDAGVPAVAVDQDDAAGEVAIGVERTGVGDHHVAVAAGVGVHADRAVIVGIRVDHAGVADGDVAVTRGLHAEGVIAVGVDVDAAGVGDVDGAVAGVGDDAVGVPVAVDVNDAVVGDGDVAGTGVGLDAGAVFLVGIDVYEAAGGVGDADVAAAALGVDAPSVVVAVQALAVDARDVAVVGDGGGAGAVHDGLDAESVAVIAVGHAGD